MNSLSPECEYSYPSSKRRGMHTRRITITRSIGAILMDCCGVGSHSGALAALTPTIAQVRCPLALSVCCPLTFQTHLTGVFLLFGTLPPLAHSLVSFLRACYFTPPCFLSSGSVSVSFPASSLASLSLPACLLPTSMYLHRLSVAGPLYLYTGVWSPSESSSLLWGRRLSLCICEHVAER